MTAIAARSAPASRTNARPLSYGTLSHLCASVAHESACSTPSSEMRAAARRPPPTARTRRRRAPRRRPARVRSAIAASGSNAPVFTLPACAQTIVAGESGGSASARMRPCPSTGTRTSRLRPKPSRPSALMSVGCASSPTTTVIGGAPNSPSASTSQPARASTAWRAAASAVKLAIVAPVTKAPAAARRAARRVEQPAQRDLLEHARRPGVGESKAAFWSQAVASQFAASAAGSEPPITKPKKRGPAMAMVAGEPISSSSASTSAGVARAVGERLAKHVQARDRRRPAGATARSWISRQVARRAGGRAFQQFVHVDLPEVTAGAAQRTLSSSRIARRRSRCPRSTCTTRAPSAGSTSPARMRPGRRNSIASCSGGPRPSRSRTRAATGCCCTTAGRWPASRPCGATPTARPGRPMSRARTPTRPAPPRSPSGGDVVMDAMDVLTAGRMAVLRDPAGAQVSVWQPGDHHGYEVHGEPGTPIWSELMTRDLASASAFYHSVFGWTALEEDFDGVAYTVWKRRGQLVGGALEMDESWPEDTNPHWMVYIATADCDATARRCGALGGTVVHPPEDIGPGRCALLETPPAARSRSSSCARRSALEIRGLCILCRCATLAACRPSRSAPRSRGPAPAPGSSARSASSPMPRPCGCRSSWSVPRARSSRTSTATHSSISRAASAASPSGTPTPPSRPPSRTQVARFLHTDFTVMPYDSYVELAERLCARLPISGATKAAFFNRGAEAVENAVKIAKAATGRPAVIAYEGAFHGRTHMAMSLTSKRTRTRRASARSRPRSTASPFPNAYRCRRRRRRRGRARRPAPRPQDARRARVASRRS